MVIELPRLGTPVLIGKPRRVPNRPVSRAVPSTLSQITLRVLRSIAVSLPQGGALHGAPNGPIQACTTATNGVLFWSSMLGSRAFSPPWSYLAI